MIAANNNTVTIRMSGDKIRYVLCGGITIEEHRPLYGSLTAQTRESKFKKILENIQNSETSILLMLTAGTVVMLLLAVFIILFVVMYQKKIIKKQAEYQRGLLEATIQAQENERKRIARDLHDGVGTMLATVKLKIGQIGQNAEKDQSLSSDFKREAKLLIDETIANTSRISRDLLPATLEEFGLADALKDLCDRINTPSNIAVHFRHEGNGQRFDGKIETALYRIAQELVNNSIKYAEADRIKVALKVECGNIEMIVSDTGRGISIENPDQIFEPFFTTKDIDKGCGLGLTIVAEIVKSYDGKIHVESKPGEGAVFTINIPV